MTFSEIGEWPRSPLSVLLGLACTELRSKERGGGESGIKDRKHMLAGLG